MNGSTSGNVLCWPKRLLSADDLRRHLTSQRELLLLPRTVITPLAADELRAKGVRILWQTPAKEATAPKVAAWCYAVEKPDAMIRSTIQALEREGIDLTFVDETTRAIAERILRDGQRGAIVFTADAALVCCVANKVAGMRAAAVGNVCQVNRAKKTLVPNLFAIETQGRTFFELRQMLKTIVSGDESCPAEIAKTLKELEGHAH